MTCRTGISHWRRGKRCRWVESYLPDYFYGPGPVPRAANDEARTPLEIELGVNDQKEPLARGDTPPPWTARSRRGALSSPPFLAGPRYDMTELFEDAVGCLCMVAAIAVIFVLAGALS